MAAAPPPAAPASAAQPVAGGAVAGQSAPGGAAATDLAAPLSALSLPARAVASLEREGITTVGQLAGRTSADVLAIDGIGQASLEEIRARLAERGLALGEAAPGAAEGQPAGTAVPVAEAAAAEVSDGQPTTPRAAAHQLEDDAVKLEKDAIRFEEDAINLLKVAGVPVLKRAIPVLIGLVAAGLVAFRFRHRRRNRAR